MSGLVCTGLLAQDPVTIALQPFATGFVEPVDIAHCNDGRLFIVEQRGTIKVLDASGTAIGSGFLDIQDRVNDSGNEQGLLGLAFPPDHATTGHFYVHYTGGTGNGASRVSRFTVTANPNVADPATEVVLFTWPQPFSNHNGGDLDFGPDGNLYVTLGDGGNAGDPQNNSQDLTDPLGDILRIHPEPDGTYTIPPDNPWVSAGGDTLPEIWASGLRNPFRFGFDSDNGDVWIGDVGQNAWEEIDHWPAATLGAPNFGWRCYEGNESYNTSGCGPQSSYVAPVAVHRNLSAGGQWCSSIGGRVYRGTEFPRLYGRYIYTDYCAGQFWSLRRDQVGNWINEQLLSGAGANWVCIAEGSDGSLYACRSNSGGQVRKIVDPCPMEPPTITQNGAVLTSTQAEAYAWSLNGQPLPGATTQSITITEGGVYSVIGTFGNCDLASAPFEAVATGLDAATASALKVYPIPAREEVLVSGIPVGAAALHIVDLSGRVVRIHATNGKDNASLAVSDIAEATYMVRVLAANGVVLHQRLMTVQR